MNARVSMGVLSGALLVLWMAFPSPARSSCEPGDGEFRLKFRRANVDVSGDPTVALLARDGDVIVYLDHHSPRESPPMYLQLVFLTDDGGAVISTDYGPIREPR